MKRAWFRDEESGRYYRNRPINLSDREPLLEQLGSGNPWRAWRAHRDLLELEQESRDMLGHNVIWVDELPVGDRVVQRKPFRESHPHIPALHRLDES